MAPMLSHTSPTVNASGFDGANVRGVVAQHTRACPACSAVHRALLHQVRDRVEPEAVDAHLVEPEAARSSSPPRARRGCRSSGPASPPRRRRSSTRRARGDLCHAVRPHGPVLPGFVRRPAKPVAVAATPGRAAPSWKYGMLAGGVVQHHVHEHRDAAPVRLGHQPLEVVVRAVVALDLVVVVDVVAVVARRLGHGHEPDAAARRGPAGSPGCRR